MSKLCHCGSGEYRRELKDAAGIFCTFICDTCEREKMQQFNPAIFDGGSIYAVTGEEHDIGEPKFVTPKTNRDGRDLRARRRSRMLARLSR